LFIQDVSYYEVLEEWLTFRRHELPEIGRVAEKLGKWRFYSSQGNQSIQLHKEEAQAMYQGIFGEFGIEGLFPEWKESADNPKTVARAYIWLGDTMSYERAWHMFADEQYIRAIELYPSLRNVARVKRMVNRAMSIVSPAYPRVRSLGHNGLRIVKQWIRK
jgi:hypothetical protein